MQAQDILDALIASSDDCIWATELAFFSGMRRIDFFTIHPFPSRSFRTNAYEIKISRADYKRDSEEKQAGALKWSDLFWYVTPPDMIAVDELPEWAGLKEWDGLRLKIRKAAPLREKAPPDWLFVVSLLRNCGDSRRDVGLMKAQIAHLQASLDHRKKLQDLHSKMNMQKWLDENAVGAEAAE